MKLIRSNSKTKLVKHGQAYYLMPINSNNIETGVRVTIDWSKYCSEELRESLYSRNIFTIEDLQQNAGVAKVCMQHGHDYFKLLADANKGENY